MTTPAPELANTTDLTQYQARDPGLLLREAEAVVRAYCGWHIAPARTQTLTLDGSGGAVLALPTLHLTAVTSVTEEDADVDLTTIEWSEAGYLWRAAGWTPARRGVVVTMTHGHAETPVEVQAVVLAVASRAASAPATAVRRESAGPFTRDLGPNADGSLGGVVLTALEQRILDRHRVPAEP